MEHPGNITSLYVKNVQKTGDVGKYVNTWFKDAVDISGLLQDEELDDDYVENDDILNDSSPETPQVDNKSTEGTHSVTPPNKDTGASSDNKSDVKTVTLEQFKNIIKQGEAEKILIQGKDGNLYSTNNVIKALKSAITAKKPKTRPGNIPTNNKNSNKPSRKRSHKNQSYNKR